MFNESADKYMIQNKGNTVYIVLDEMLDGEPLENKQFDKMELFTSKRKYALNDGKIIWDSNLSRYCIFAQLDSFKPDSDASYTLQLLNGKDLICTKIKRLFVGNTIVTN